MGFLVLLPMVFSACEPRVKLDVDKPIEIAMSIDITIHDVQEPTANQPRQVASPDLSRAQRDVVVNRMLQEMVLETEAQRALVIRWQPDDNSTPSVASHEVVVPHIHKVAHLL